MNGKVLIICGGFESKAELLFTQNGGMRPPYIHPSIKAMETVVKMVKINFVRAREMN